MTKAIAQALFVSEEPIKREVEFTDGSSASFYFKEMSAERAASLGKEGAGGEGFGFNTLKEVVADLCVDKDGNKRFTGDEISRLKFDVLDALFMEIIDISFPKKK